MNKIPQFHNKKLFETVFIHRSYLNESHIPMESNERLEFLGDSILSYVVSSYIYRAYPEMKEGELTSLRSVLTNTQTLYELSKGLGLGKYLKLSKGERASGGQENKSILANTYEALVGGLFIDQGIEAVSEFIHETILNRIDELIGTQGLKDSKSKLQEITQERDRISPNYKIIHEEGPDHAKIYTVGVYLEKRLLAEGRGKSKQEAEKDAAQNALENIQ